MYDLIGNMHGHAAELRHLPKQQPHSVCLNDSVAKGGDLVAHRWDGEPELRVGNLVWARK